MKPLLKGVRSCVSGLPGSVDVHSTAEQRGSSSPSEGSRPVPRKDEDLARRITRVERRWAMSSFLRAPRAWTNSG